ncbi:hypothetical protein ACFLXY_02095 [Chloroflexota bacterium]
MAVYPIFIVIVGILIVIVGWVLWLLFRKKAVKSSRNVILYTTIPLTLFSIAILVFGLMIEVNFINHLKQFSTINLLITINFGLVFIVIIASVVLAFRRKWEMAKSLSIGGSIGAVSWFIMVALLVNKYGLMEEIQFQLQRL